MPARFDSPDPESPLRALRSVRFDPDGSDQIAASRRLAFDQGHSRRGTASPGRLIDSGVDLPDAPVNVGHFRSGQMSAGSILALCSATWASLATA